MFKRLAGLFFFVMTYACGAESPSLVNATSPTSVSGPFRLVPSEQYYNQLMKLLDQPRAEGQSIDFLQFNFFTENGHTRAIAEKLKAIKKRQPATRIRVVLEGEKDAGKRLGAATRNQITRDFFANSGVEVISISGIRHEGVKGVTHAKAVRVGNVILSGSTNLTNTSIDKNNEFNVLVSSEKIARTFENYLNGLIVNSKSPSPMAATDGSVTMLTDDLFFDKARDLISSAVNGDSIDVTTYFFAYRNDTDLKAKQIYDALVAANKRGAHLRILLERNADPKVNQDITKANLQTAARFLKDGIETVYLDPEDKITHAKIIKVTGPTHAGALIGSTNIYRGDFDENHQVNFFVTHPDSLGALTAYLNQKFAYEGTKYSLLNGGSPAPMIRFWRGYKQTNASDATFRSKLNQFLIPELSFIGPGRGLTAYLPVLLPVQKPTYLPDEIALINYASEESYEAIRSTPRGRKYGPMHFAPGLFAKDKEQGTLKSGSALVEPWRGSMSNGHAYGINADRLDWQNIHAISRVLLKPESMNPEEFADAAAYSGPSRRSFPTQAGIVFRSNPAWNSGEVGIDFRASRH